MREIIKKDDVIRLPDDEELEWFFKTKPNIDGSRYTYDVTDLNGIRLLVSFDMAMCAVYTKVSIKGKRVKSDGHEQIDSMKIVKEGDISTLIVRCGSEDYPLTLKLSISPYIQVEWDGACLR